MSKLMFVLLFISSPAFAVHDEWTRADTYREATFIGIDYMDWSTTRQMSAQPCNIEHCYSETNPFMPLHPNSSQINRLFIIGIAAHITISNLISNEFLRQSFQYGTIFIEATYVKNNYSLGFRAKF